MNYITHRSLVEHCPYLISKEIKKDVIDRIPKDASPYNWLYQWIIDNDRAGDRDVYTLHNNTYVGKGLMNLLLRHDRRRLSKFYDKEKGSPANAQTGIAAVA